MSKDEIKTQITYNGMVINITIQNLIIADERFTSQLIEALTKEKQPTQTP